MEYHICGRVTDAKSGIPVKGIEVTYVREYMNPDNAGDFQTKEVKVTLVKKDGTENGWYDGVYEAENVIVELAQVEETVKE